MKFVSFTILIVVYITHAFKRNSFHSQNDSLESPSSGILAHKVHSRSYARSLHSTPVQRLIRASDSQLSLAIENMQRISRIVAGLALRQDLAFGTTYYNGIVSELLQLGSVTDPEIGRMNASEMMRAISELKSLSDSVQWDEKSKRVKEQLKAAEEVRAMVTEFDFMQWAGKKPFSDEIESLKNNGLDWTAKKLYIAIGSWKSVFDEIKNINQNDVNDKNKRKNAADKVKKLKEFSKSIAELSVVAQNENNAEGYRNITSATDYLGHVNKILGILKECEDRKGKLQGTQNDDLPSFKAKLGIFSKVNSVLNNANPSFKTMRSITIDRNLWTNREYPGFLNGFKDINALSVDLNDGLIKKLLGRSGIGESLNHLKSLIPAFMKIDKALNVDEYKLTLPAFFELIDRVWIVSQTATGMDSALEKYQACTKNLDVPKASVDSANKLLNSAKALDNSVAELFRNVSSAISSLNKEDVKRWLASTKSIAVVSDDDPGKIPNTLAMLKQSNETKDLSTVLEKAEENLKIDDQKIKEDSGKLLNEFNEFFVKTNPLASHSVFSCLGTIDAKTAERAAAAWTTADHFQNRKQDTIASGEAVVNSLISVADDWNALTEELYSLPNLGSQSEIFEAFPDFDSKLIGRATLALTEMKTALDQKSQGDVVMQHATLVYSLLDNPNLKQADMIEMSTVVRLQTQLKSMYEKLNEWKNGVQNGVSIRLEDQSQLFTSAQAVPGIYEELAKMSASVEELAKLAKDAEKSRLIEMRNALLTLHSLNLDFKRYSYLLTRTADSLRSLDKFFDTYRAWVPPATAGNLDSAISALVVMQYIGLFVLLLFVLAAIFAYLYRQGCFEKTPSSTVDQKSTTDSQKDASSPTSTSRPTQKSSSRTNNAVDEIFGLKKKRAPGTSASAESAGSRSLAGTPDRNSPSAEPENENRTIGGKGNPNKNDRNRRNRDAAEQSSGADGLSAEQANVQKKNGASREDFSGSAEQFGASAEQVNGRSREPADRNQRRQARSPVARRPRQNRTTQPPVPEINDNLLESDARPKSPQ